MLKKYKTNDPIHVVEHVSADLLLTQTMDYSGEAVTSFVYDGSTDLSFSMKIMVKIQWDIV